MKFSLQNHCKILNYSSKLLFPKYPAHYFVLGMLIIYNQLRKRKSFLKVVAVPYDSVKSVLNESALAPAYWNDVDNTVVINNLSNKFLKFVMLVSEKRTVNRIAFAIESLIVEQNCVVVSDTLKFNLQTENLNIEPLELQEIQFACELDLSLVSSPCDLSNNIIDALVKSYFKTPKIVHNNDILTVDFEKYDPDSYYSSCKYNNLKYVYFKCNRLCFKKSNSNGFGICIIGETNFKQSINTQSFIPSILYHKLNVNTVYGDGLINTCPSGLEHYADMLEESILPFTTSYSKSSIKLQPVFLVEGNRGSGKSRLISSLAGRFGMHQYDIISADLTGATYAQTEAKICNIFFKAKLSTPCFLIINNFENFGKNNEGQYDSRIMEFFKSQIEELFKHNTFPLILICVSHSKEVLPTDLQQCFLNVFKINVPNSQQRAAMLQWIMKSQNFLDMKENYYNELAGKTHGFIYEDLQALVYHAKSKKWNFDKAIDLMHSKYNESLGAPKIPNVQWSDVGGLLEIEQEIMHTINLPLKHPYLLQGTGLKRSGILLYGPPGTGKTLVAKAVANECKLCFLSVKGPELLNMYVGQSEKNVREVFERAREASPCIIFFDELDSLAPNRGVSGDSGGVMDRVVSQLLAEMDGLNQTATIFIIGATNRPDLIDPALLRPGRFDKLLYVGPCIDSDSKISVLRALTRKFNLEATVDLEQVVHLCPQNITGADFYGLCSSAWLSAARNIFEKDKMYRISSQDIVVTMNDFRTALQDLKPSVKSEDLIYFDNLKRQLYSTNNNKKL